MSYLMLAGKNFDSASIFALTAVAVASALALGASSTEGPRPARRSRRVVN